MRWGRQLGADDGTAAAGAARSGGDGGGTTPCSDLVEQANLDNKLQRLALTLECRRVGVGVGVPIRVRVRVRLRLRVS